jgi:hypothetical protein
MLIIDLPRINFILSKAHDKVGEAMVVGLAYCPLKISANLASNSSPLNPLAMIFPAGSNRNVAGIDFTL